MDKLANRLRRDAGRIEVEVSDELDERITASLRGVTPHDAGGAGVRAKRHTALWWASSLTGVAAAAVVIAIINVRETPAPSPTPVDIFAELPRVDLRAETAMMTSPLQEELDKLQSDIRRAERRVRKDIGL